MNNALKARAERTRVLLEELQPHLDDMEREILSSWKNSSIDLVDERERAFADWRALQRLQRKLKSVLSADALENPNG